MKNSIREKAKTPILPFSHSKFKIVKTVSFQNAKPQYSNTVLLLKYFGQVEFKTGVGVFQKRIAFDILKRINA